MEEDREKEREYPDTKMVKKTYNLRKRPNPVQVNLPNGMSFTSRWEKISRKQLPINIKVTRNRAIGPRRNNRRIYFNLAKPALKRITQKRRQAIVDRLGPIYDRINQTGSRMGSDLLKAGLNSGSKALGSEFGKRLINKGIDNIPNLFKFGASKVKNKNLKKLSNQK